MAKSASARPAPARERILRAADRLFYRDGFRATGVDRVIAESGVAKMTFYRHFPSKDDLMIAVLQGRHARWMQWFTAAVDGRLQGGGAGLDVIAKVLDEWFRQPGFRGCVFINAVAEDGVADRFRSVSVAHKAELQAYVRSVCRRLGIARPERAAAAVMVAIEGAIVRAQMTGAEGVDVACGDVLRAIGQMQR